MEEKVAKHGDVIQWEMDPRDYDWCMEYYGKTTFTAKIAMVDLKNKDYGVYTEYGQDLIPFDQATIIKET